MAVLFEQALMRRWLRNSWRPRFYWWARVADLSALEDTRHHAAVLFEQALCRLARSSRGAAFAWWSRVGPEHASSR